MAWTRAETFDWLAGNPVDLLVIGGGILGAGVARDAAMRGWRVALVEQYDFASGASSRSTRLLHGGLRYLAQGRIGMVREAGREKQILSRIAPHLAQPLRFVFPAYRHAGWGLWKMAVGVKLYDLLCGMKNGPRSGALGREATLARVPGLSPEGLTGSVHYGDGLTNDARLVIDTLRSAQRHGAMLLNYARCVDARTTDGLWICRIHDQEAGREIDIHASGVVNVAGPWADRFEQSSLKLRLTKGVHLVVDQARFPLSDAVAMARGNRILFAIPYGRRVVLGTTDTDYQGEIEAVRTDMSDVRYILAAVNETFFQARIGPAEVIAEWAGLRPLIARGDGSPSDISRAHLIKMSQRGWLDVAGGKLTTYRLIAQQAVDRVGRELSLNGACRTDVEPLTPPEEAVGISGIEPPAASRELIEYYCRNEWALHLEDVMVRRGRWQTYEPKAQRKADEVAMWMGTALGWTDGQRQAELARYEAATASVLDGHF
jgi:glycerol-3-phosphate dehydrogenase